MAAIDKYVREASLNQTRLDFTILPKWIQMNGTFGSFSYSGNLIGCSRLAQLAIGAASASFNLTGFGHILVVRTGYNLIRMRPEYLGLPCRALGPSFENVALIGTVKSSVV